MWQFCVTAVVAIIVFFYHGWPDAGYTSFGAIFGGLIAMILSLWLGVRLKHLERRLRERAPASGVRTNAGKEAYTMVLAFGFAPRMLMVLVLFWLGVAQLGLPPLPMIAAFAAAYAVYWVELWRTRLG